MNSEQFDAELERLFEAIGPPLRAGWRERALKAMKAATPSSASASGRTRGLVIVKQRRALAIGAVVIMLAALTLWMLPRRGMDSALADVARAMANVQSAHFVGSTLDYATGKHLSVEGWVKGEKFRMLTDGTEDVADDGNRLVTISTTGGFVSALISPSGKYVGLSEGMTYLDVFRGERAFEEARGGGMAFAGWENLTLPDGRQAKKGILSSHGSKLVLLIDPGTNLLLGLEEHVDGRLVDKIERIEYDIEIPDSVFQISIPKNAVVTDATAPPSKASAEEWNKYVSAEIKRLEATRRVYLFWSTSPGSQAAGSTGNGGFHPGLWFHPLDNNGTAILYTDRNTYVVFGRVLVESKKYRLRRIVENREFRAPGPPVITVAQRKAEEEAKDKAERARYAALYKTPTPEMLAKWDAKGKELAAIGAKQWVRGGQLSTNGCNFEGIGYEINVWYSPSRGEYYIMGKARVYNRRGFDKIVEDGWIKVPGPAPKLP